MKNATIYIFGVLWFFSCILMPVFGMAGRSLALLWTAGVFCVSCGSLLWMAHQKESWERLQRARVLR